MSEFNLIIDDIKKDIDKLQGVIRKDWMDHVSPNGATADDIISNLDELKVFLDKNEFTSFELASLGLMIDDTLVNYGVEFLLVMIDELLLNINDNLPFKDLFVEVLMQARARISGLKDNYSLESYFRDTEIIHNFVDSLKQEGYYGK